MRPRVAPPSLLAALLAACAVPQGAAGPGTAAEPLLPPPGYGTLRQDQVTVALRSGDLQIKVTPLAESVTRVTAPDTYQRLQGIAEAHDAEARRQSGLEAPVLFLVSFFSDSPDVAFVPEELQLISRGLRVRPAAIVPVTPTFGERRVRQRETEMAVYAFPPRVDLETELAVVYGLVESREWRVILNRVQAERARARARAGVGG